MPRCKYPKCKRKISSLFKEISRCKCGKIFCHQHRLDHECTFDYQAVEKKRLQDNLIKVVPKKIIKV